MTDNFLILLKVFFKKKTVCSNKDPQNFNMLYLIMSLKLLLI